MAADLLPLWTSIAGGVIGITGTLTSAVLTTRTTRRLAARDRVRRAYGPLLMVLAADHGALEALFADVGRWEDEVQFKNLSDPEPKAKLLDRLEQLTLSNPTADPRFVEARAALLLEGVAAYSVELQFNRLLEGRQALLDTLRRVMLSMGSLPRAPGGEGEESFSFLTHAPKAWWKYWEDFARISESAREQVAKTKY